MVLNRSVSTKAWKIKEQSHLNELQQKQTTITTPGKWLPQKVQKELQLHGNSTISLINIVTVTTKMTTVAVATTTDDEDDNNGNYDSNQRNVPFAFNALQFPKPPEALLKPLNSKL